ncbi:MAG: NADP-dependent 3-hydroxy acid dehydrogenase YdfG [Candidatus Azotimanducaceae bacterium]|jgi:NADP-dependent 3-hydroxy acid dehydrogenase YdfG
MGAIERGAVQARGGPWHDWAMRWNRALVTGASSGIGRALAQQLAADGTQLVTVARDRERLEALASEVDVDCEVLVADHRLSQVAAEVMVQRGGGGGGGGGILNVSSVAAFAPGPNSATYAATKAFVSTEFQDRADFDASKLPDRLWQSADDVGAGLWNALPGPARRFLVPRVLS